MNVSGSDNRRLGVFMFSQSVLTHWMVPLTPVGRTLYVTIVGLIQCSGQSQIEFDLQTLCEATGHGYRQVRDYLWWIDQLGLITLEVNGTGNRRRLSVTLESPADPTADTMRKLKALLDDKTQLPERIELSSLNQMRQSINDWSPLDISKFRVPLTLKEDAETDTVDDTAAAAPPPKEADAPKEDNRDLLKHAGVRKTRLNKFRTMPRFHILAWYWWAVVNDAENTGAMVGDGLDPKKDDPFIGALPDGYLQLAQWTYTAKRINVAALEGGLAGEEVRIPRGVSPAMLTAAQHIFEKFGTLAELTAPKAAPVAADSQSDKQAGAYSL